MNTYFKKNNTALQKIIYQEMLNNPLAKVHFSLPATRKRDFSFSIKSKYVTSVSR